VASSVMSFAPSFTEILSISIGIYYSGQGPCLNLGTDSTTLFYNEPFSRNW